MSTFQLWGLAIGLMLYPVLIGIEKYKDWKWKREFRKFLDDSRKM